MITVEVNGKSQQLPPGATLELLLQQLALTGKRLAVELNLEVILRSHYPQRLLKTGDRIEIVHAIGGG
ncbi:MAG: sulfur carrier protein [Motiliproteus sp.]|jgi:sulfur carrier protein